MLRTLYIFGTVLILVVSGAPSSNESLSYEISVSDETILHGYVEESHHVTTEDGYILKMYRLPYAWNQTSGSADRPVVFLMHGLFSSSQSFVRMGPEYSLGYQLADAGFDIWIGNARGNVNSRKHVTLDPDNPVDRLKFFNFTWEEIGMLDLPAMIDYALNHTGKEKIHYIGHSQGGTSFLVLASMRPEYDKKMATVNLLAGVGYEEHFPNEQLRSASQLTDFVYALALGQGIVEMTPNITDDLPLPEGYSKSDMCFGNLRHKTLCELIGARHFMSDDNLENSGYGGGAIKQVAHYGQNIRDKLFRRFHYGSKNNLELYGITEPPIYNLSLICSNVTMHYTISDELLSDRDVLAMAADMPNTIARKVARDTFQHGDFVAAIDLKDLVTNYIIDNIKGVKGVNMRRRGNPGVQKSDEESIASTPVPSTATNVSFNKVFNMYFVFYVSFFLYTKTFV